VDVFKGEMMKSLNVLLVVFALLFLIGCRTTASVHDNTYELTLAPSIVVNSEYEYIGSCKAVYPVVYSMGSRMGNKSITIPIRSDVFIRHEGTKLIDVCVIETQEAGRTVGGSIIRWRSSKEPGIPFQGDEYQFEMFHTFEAPRVYWASYAAAMKKEGFDVDDLVVGKMTKKVRRSIRVAMIYAYNPSMVPVESDKKTEYLIDQLNKNFEVIN